MQDNKIITGENVFIGENVTMKEGVIIGNHVTIEDGVYIDYNTIIRDNVIIKKGTYVGANCILGEYLYDFYSDRTNKEHPLVIGEESLIRSHTIIYGDVTIGAYFQSGHRVTIRENVVIGHHTRIGTNSDMQNGVRIGNHVNIHSDVFISDKNVIEDYVWIFPKVMFANDPTPPSDEMQGSHVKSFSIVCAHCTVIPGTVIEEQVVVAAGAVIRGKAESGYLYAGVPAKPKKKLSDIKNHITGEDAYPWMKHFDRGMPWDKEHFEEWLLESRKENDETVISEI